MSNKEMNSLTGTHRGYTMIANRFLPPLLVLVLLLITVLLPGCLVNDKKSSKTIPRTTDRLRPIIGNEYFQYNITGQRNYISGGSTQPVTGTLTVKYSKINLLLPSGTDTISAIQEDSTITVNGTTQSIVRLLQQDAAIGTLSVIAINFGGTIYYVGQNDQWDSPLDVVFLPSPIPLTGNNTVDFQYFSGCPPTCTATVATLTEDVTFKGNADIQTNVGKFNAIKIDFSGSTKLASPIISNGPFDFRGACSATNTDYSGASYIFPEVGVVFVDYTCTSSDSTIDTLQIKLTSTNVAIPKQ